MRLPTYKASNIRSASTFIRSILSILLPRPSAPGMILWWTFRMSGLFRSVHSERVLAVNQKYSVKKGTVGNRDGVSNSPGFPKTQSPIQ